MDSVFYSCILLWFCPGLISRVFSLRGFLVCQQLKNIENVYPQIVIYSARDGDNVWFP